jgi:hypothetical protein
MNKHFKSISFSQKINELQLLNVSSNIKQNKTFSKTINNIYDLFISNVFIKPKKLETEVRGKEFEMAVCMFYNTKYIGKFKYNMNNANKLKNYLVKLKLDTLFPSCYHSGSKGGRYDFSTNDNLHLSVKTTKKDGMIAPQVIGQPSPYKFCNLLNIQFTNILNLKEYIQNNIDTIIFDIEKYTYDCPILYYNEYSKSIKFIKKIKNIKWNLLDKYWSCDWTKWNNSSSLKIKINNIDIRILEFQFHSKSRTNMAIRWSFENILKYFNDHFEIKEIKL